MGCLFKLAEQGVRVVFVTALAERCVWIAGLRMLLIDEDLSDDDRDHLAGQILQRLDR